MPWAFWLAVALIDAPVVILLGIIAYEILRSNRAQGSNRIDPLADCVADCVGKRAQAEGYDPNGMPAEVYYRLHAECMAKCVNPALTIRVLEGARARAVPRG